MYSINVQAKHGQSIFEEENFIKSLEVEQVCLQRLTLNT